MKNYKLDVKKGEGTYSNVFVAISNLTHQKCAIKIMKNKYTNIDKLKKDKQIQALKMLSHPNIIKMTDILYDEEEQKLAIAFQLMDCNLYEFYKSKKNSIPIDKVRSIGHDMLQAITYMHKKGVFHRDIKPQNILVQGDKVFKLADLGSCKSSKSKPPYTEYISTRWYRAPECILTEGRYSQKMDVWSIGCVLFQLYTQYPLFPGQSELDQLSTIFSIMGTPSKNIIDKIRQNGQFRDIQFVRTVGIGIHSLMPKAPVQFINLLNKMLEINPENRLQASEALNHPFFYSLTQLKRCRKALIQKLVQHKQQLNLPSLKKSQEIKKTKKQGKLIE